MKQTNSLSLSACGRVFSRLALQTVVLPISVLPFNRLRNQFVGNPVASPVVPVRALKLFVTTETRRNRQTRSSQEEPLPNPTCAVLSRKGFVSEFQKGGTMK